MLYNVLRIEKRVLMKLVKIPESKYYDYRIQAMFDCYKWDPQFCDSNIHFFVNEFPLCPSSF